MKEKVIKKLEEAKKAAESHEKNFKQLSSAAQIAAGEANSASVAIKVLEELLKEENKKEPDKK